MIRLLILFAVLGTPTLYAEDGTAAAAILPAFTASYTLGKAGIAVARVDMQLIRTQHQYSYTSLSRTVGLAALFRDDRIMEQSRGEIKNGQILTHEYRYQRTGKKRKNIGIDFDWDKMQALHDENGNKTTIAIAPHAIDEFVNQLALMLDLQRLGQTPATGTGFTYKVVDEGIQKERSYAIEGMERVSIGAGTYDTIKVIRERSKGSRITHFWFAPGLHYLPVKIEHIDSDGGKLTLELQKNEGLAGTQAEP